MTLEAGSGISQPKTRNSQPDLTPFLNHLQ